MALRKLKYFTYTVFSEPKTADRYHMAAKNTLLGLSTVTFDLYFVTVMIFLTHFTIPRTFHNSKEQATCLKDFVSA